MKKKLLSHVALLLIPLLLLTSCSSQTGKAKGEPSVSGESSAEAGDNNVRDTFIYGIPSDPGNNVNVVTTHDRSSLTVLKTVYSPLYQYFSDDDIDYYLATEISASEDGLIYTVKLREDVKWHDGEVFNADDVVFTYNTLLTNPLSLAKSQLEFDGVPVEIEKADDYTVLFKLPIPSPSAVEAFGREIFIMPEHIYGGETKFDVNTKNAAPIGTGPYKYAEYRSGESITFTKNEEYFLGAPEISTVIYRIIVEQNTGLIALQNGELDAYFITTQDLEKIKPEDNISIYPYSEGRVGHLSFRLNSKNPGVMDKDIRKAVFYAINRNDLLIASYQSEDYAFPSYSFLPSNAIYGTDDVERYDYDLEKAKTYVTNSGLDNIKLKLLYIAGNPVYEKQAVIIQQGLKAVNISLELTSVDTAAFMAELKSDSDTYDLYLSGYIMGVDPDSFSALFHSEGRANYVHYFSEEADGLFEKGRKEINPAERAKIYEDLQKLIAEDAFHYPIAENLQILAVKDNVKGVKESRLVPIYTFGDLSKLSY